MTVLFVSEHPHTQIGGIEKHISHIGKILKLKGVEVHYLNAKELESFSLISKGVISLDVIKDRLVKIDPDVVHVHGFSSFFANQCLSITKKILPDTRLIYTPHYHPFKYHKHPLLAYIFFHVFLERNLRNVDILIALTDPEKEFFAHYLDTGKIAVIPNGIDIVYTDFQKNKPPQKRILFVGRNDHNKRLDFLLEQKEYFRDHQIHCDIVTDSNMVSDDVFTYHSSLTHSELADLYQNSSVLVIPSKYEAFSIVALEAMSFGVPVVLSDHVQIKSYLQDKGSFNKIFSYNNKSDFIEKLEAVLHMDSLQYQQSSKENITLAKSFDWEVIVDRLLSIYKAQ